jgi:hypothetical protein
MAHLPYACLAPCTAALACWVYLSLAPAPANSTKLAYLGRHPSSARVRSLPSRLPFTGDSSPTNVHLALGPYAPLAATASIISLRAWAQAHIRARHNSARAYSGKHGSPATWSLLVGVPMRSRVKTLLPPPPPPPHTHPPTHTDAPT